MIVVISIYLVHTYVAVLHVFRLARPSVLFLYTLLINLFLLAGYSVNPSGIQITCVCCTNHATEISICYYTYYTTILLLRLLSAIYTISICYL